MSASTAPGVPMTRDEADRALAALGPACDRIATAMFTLDRHPGLSYLQGGGLTGASREVADEVLALMVMLWAQFTALRQHLDLARDTRAARARPSSEQLARLTSLLREPVVPLGDGGMPVDGAGVAPARWLTLTELAHGLETSSAQLTDLLTEVDSAVSAVVVRITTATDALTEVRALAASLGEDAGVAPLTTALDEARTHGLADPIAVARGGVPAAAVEDRLRRLAVDVDAARTRLTELVRVRDGHAQLLTQLGHRLDGVAAAEVAARQAYAVVREKIADPGLPQVPTAVAGLRDRVSRLDRLRVAGDWARLADELAALRDAVAEAEAYARRLRDAANGLLDRRTELRGRLDAYRAKASRLGYAEHAGLSGRYGEAHGLLYSSPCDLPAATRAVFSYQQALAELISATPADAPVTAPKETPT